MADLQHSAERYSNILTGRDKTVIVVSPLISRFRAERFCAARFDNQFDSWKVGSRRA